MDDVFITCASFAGLAAALQIGRAGRRGAVFDSGLPGIHVAGDLPTPFLPSVTQATWQGAMAGIFAQQSMLT